jgi:hypothetical protein
MRTCKLFDKYRDRELSSAERSRFEFHLPGCEDCRMRMSLLDSLVRIVKTEEIRPRDIAERIARRAFQQKHSWDAEVASWLRPGPALAALSLVLILFSSLWIVSRNQQGIAYSEYERLIDEADAVSLSTSVSQAGSKSELILWLEQEGNSQ